MKTPYDYSKKSTAEEIRERFDHDVDRFSNLEIGQTAAIDGALCLNMIAECAAATYPKMTHVLDIGCGAGNFSLNLIKHLREQQDLPPDEPMDLQITLIDLSPNMLERAVQRLMPHTSGTITPICDDFQHVTIMDDQYDVVLAGAVLHHLREDKQWQDAFVKIYTTLKPGASLWVFDMIAHDNSSAQQACQKLYSDYLIAFKDEAYRDEVFAYIEKEDTPRSLGWQSRQLYAAGFSDVDVLHKHALMAAYVATK
ncbi:class I SAM-dependent methyltransferase [Poriferisphaera sp. WC338]|uniref:class I SAM-dependent methyltransferase n=1 Tax=Poriferisphaera sp. WC338 TaxID=3425129 RepID=UPI003D81690F